MKKRVISVLLCAAMVATMLIGCGGSTGSEQKSDAPEKGSAEDFDWKNYEGTTINVMFNEHNYSKAVIEKIPEFEELTGIKVKYSSTPESNYFDKLNTSLSSRSGDTDVYMTGAYQVWEYAPAGYMEPLEDYIDNPALTAEDYNYDDFMEGVVGSLKWDLVPGHKVGEGSQWALPMGWELNNISYNKRVFEEKGLSVPKTTDELLETAKSLKELSHLDGKARQAMRTEIKRLINDIKCTTVYVTHDQLEAMSLADKIAIINFGVLQQFGTPAEVYDDPVNEFVASFIGEPPMNILETTIVGDGEHFFFTFDESNLKIQVPERYNNVVSNGFKCKMGVRPMDVLIGGSDSKGTPEEVATFENLGDERRIGIHVGKSLLMLITDDETRYRAGDIIKLEVRGEKTHLFDIETGDRIRSE